MAYLFSGDGGDGGSAMPFVCSKPSLLLSFAFVPAVPLLFLFFHAFSVLVMKHWGRCWLLLSNLGLGFVLCLCWCSFIPHSIYPLSLVFSARPSVFSVFFLLFSVSFSLRPPSVLPFLFPSPVRIPSLTFIVEAWHPSPLVMKTQDHYCRSNDGRGVRFSGLVSRRRRTILFETTPFNC